MVDGGIAAGAALPAATGVAAVADQLGSAAAVAARSAVAAIAGELPGTGSAA